MFVVDLTNSSHANDKKNNILLIGKSFTQGINSTALYAEKLYSINFTKNSKKFCLSLHYNGNISYLFVNGTEIDKFKSKNSETPLFVGHISKIFQ